MKFHFLGVIALIVEATYNEYSISTASSPLSSSQLPLSEGRQLFGTSALTASSYNPLASNEFFYASPSRFSESHINTLATHVVSPPTSLNHAVSLGNTFSPSASFVSDQSYVVTPPTSLLQHSSALSSNWHPPAHSTNWPVNSQPQYSQSQTYFSPTTIQNQQPSLSNVRNINSLVSNPYTINNQQENASNVRIYQTNNAGTISSTPESYVNQWNAPYNPSSLQTTSYPSASNANVVSHPAPTPSNSNINSGSSPVWYSPSQPISEQIHITTTTKAANLSSEQIHITTTTTANASVSSRTGPEDASADHYASVHSGARNTPSTSQSAANITSEQIHITTTTTKGETKPSSVSSSSTTSTTTSTTTRPSFLKGEDGSFIVTDSGEKLVVNGESDLTLEKEPEDKDKEIFPLKTSKGDYVFNDSGTIMVYDKKKSLIRPRSADDKVDNILRSGSPDAIAHRNRVSRASSSTENPDSNNTVSDHVHVSTSDNLLRTEKGELIVTHDGKKLKLVNDNVVFESLPSEANVSPLRTASGTPILSENKKPLVFEKGKGVRESRAGESLPAPINLALSPQNLLSSDDMTVSRLNRNP